MQNGVTEDLLSKCDSEKFLEIQKVLEVYTFLCYQKIWFWFYIKSLHSEL